MKRLIVDMSSVVWTSLLAGKDVEYGRTIAVEAGDKTRTVYVNSAAHGFENAMSHLSTVMARFNLVPRDMIFVIEGKQSKDLRKQYLASYKETRESRPDEAYEEFNKLKEQLAQAFLDVGALVVTQDGVEADDIIAYLCQNLEGEKTVLTSDGDLAVLVNETTHIWRRDELDVNPYGPFPHRFITVYKALVGDTSDNIKGAPGFGEKAFLDLYCLFGDEGLQAMQGLIQNRSLHELEEDVAELKSLRKIIDQADMVYRSWDAARLYPGMVNTLRRPLKWRVGMVKPLNPEMDSRLTTWAARVRLITTENYSRALDFMKTKLDETPHFALDLETTVPDESDDWLRQRTKSGGGVDVIKSTITGCGIAFGANLQYTYYISVNHANTDNVTFDRLAEMLEALPKDRITVAHNAAGFELPVLFNAFGSRWKDNGWRGFFPNMVDTRIAASYWDENQNSHGLKQLTNLLIGYEQTSYDEVTQGRKMHQLTGKEVLDYGVDDVLTCSGLWNFFQVIMEMEKSLDAFMRIEQKPMYLSALSFVQGNRIDVKRLSQLTEQDRETYTAHERVLHDYLISVGWEGTQCPVFTSDLTPAQIKEVVLLLTGVEFKTQVRTPSKLVALIPSEIEHEQAGLVALLIEEALAGAPERLNQAIADNFDGKPKLDVGSPNQLARLLYDTMKLPVRLRNKATDAMRAKGQREGNPRTDDDALNMAIKMGDAVGELAPVLKALVEMKSINTKTSLYWDAYPRFLHWDTARIHPEFRQSSTNTRRFTCSSPNFQQLDSGYGGVRSVIQAHHKNAVVVSLDESAQEVRLAADYSQDKNLSLCYLGEKSQLRDVHSMVACRIAGVTYDEFVAMRKSSNQDIAQRADKIRGIAKVCVFASFYGAMAPKIAESLGISEAEAQKYIDTIYSEFSGLRTWKSKVEDLAQRQGWIPLLGGTRRHLGPMLLSNNGYEVSKALRQASNASIQGAGGTQLKLIMADIWDSDLLDKYDYRWYFSVHDETVHSVGKRDAVEVIQRLHGFMTKQFLNTIPSASSIGIGKTFGTLVEIGEVADEKLIADAVEQALS